MQRRPSRSNISTYLFKLVTLMICTALVLSGCGISPQPLSQNEIEQRTINDLTMMQAGQEQVTERPISLYEAMARALKYNLDHRLKIMEQALASRQLDLSRYDLLPQLTASAGYNHRNNDEGSFSESLIDGSQSLVASKSSQRSNRTNDITLMWNVLDFGVSYARAKQQADRILIIEERRRKVIQNILQDVRYAYWRAVSSEQLIKEMVALLDKTKIALQHSQQVSDLRLQSPKESLEYQKELLENIRLLWSIIQNLTPAKVELAALMNLNPGTPFRLTEIGWSFPEIPTFTLPIEELERISLTSRPELREEDYRTRISAEDVKKSILQMLPGISFEASGSYNSNEFLFNQDWWNAGTVISKNIFQLFSGPKAIKAAKAQQGIDGMRRQAVSMAILVQTNLAYQRYGLAKREYYVARHLESISNQLNDQISIEHSVGGTNELEEIKSETNTLIARMRHYHAYAEMQNAVGRIYNTLGIDLMPTVESKDIHTLALSIEESSQQWQEMVNIEVAGEVPTQSAIPGIPDSEYDINTILSYKRRQAPENLENIEGKSSEQILNNLLSDKTIVENYDTMSSEVNKDVQAGGNSFIEPGTRRYTTFMKRTQLVPQEEDLAEPQESQQEEQSESDYRVSVKSQSTASDMLRRRLLGNMTDMPVQIRIKSTGLASNKRLKRRSVDTSYYTSVNIPLKSPVTIKRFSR